MFAGTSLISSDATESRKFDRFNRLLLIKESAAKDTKITVRVTIRWVSDC